MENDEKKLQYYHRLANVALRTLATVLAVLFAYVLASTQLSPKSKTDITGIWLLILCGMIASGISLLSSEKEMRFAKAGAYLGFFLMFITIGVIIVFLSRIMYSMP